MVFPQGQGQGEVVFPQLQGRVTMVPVQGLITVNPSTYTCAASNSSCTVMDQLTASNARPNNHV